MKKVLILSAGNPCRAIVAEALTTKYLRQDSGIEVIGAGVSNDGSINAYAMDNLQKEGIDVSTLKPRELCDVLQDSYELIVTLCDHSKEQCPVFPRAVTTIHMGMPVIENDEEACEELFQKIKTKLVPLIESELA